MRSTVKRVTLNLTEAEYDKFKANAVMRGFQNSFGSYFKWLAARDAEGAVEREAIPADPSKTLKPRTKR